MEWFSLYLLPNMLFSIKPMRLAVLRKSDVGCVVKVWSVSLNDILLPQGFNQEDLDGEKAAVETERQKMVAEESDSDNEVRGKGRDSDFVSDFEMMLQKKKDQNRKRRRNRDGGTFISDADDVVSAMITKMNEAAEEDRQLNGQKKPALKKLTLLPTVVMHLKKQDLKETFIDSGVMSAIKEWLTPLPDKSLPHLKIREELLKILQE
eukprot:g46723.t1